MKKLYNVILNKKNSLEKDENDMNKNCNNTIMTVNVFFLVCFIL